VAPGTAEWDFELEIAAVIGTPGPALSAAKAEHHIAGRMRQGAQFRGWVPGGDVIELAVEHVGTLWHRIAGGADVVPLRADAAG